MSHIIWGSLYKSYDIFLPLGFRNLIGYQIDDEQRSDYGKTS